MQPFGPGSAARFPNLSVLHLRILAIGCRPELPWGKAGVRDGTWGSSSAACTCLPAWLGTLCMCRREGEEGLPGVLQGLAPVDGLQWSLPAAFQLERR